MTRKPLEFFEVFKVVFVFNMSCSLLAARLLISRTNATTSSALPIMRRILVGSPTDSLFSPEKRWTRLASTEENYVSTGIHEARYPQQEMMEIHRRAKKHEDVKLERRRRIGLIKILMAIGAYVCALATFIGSLLWLVYNTDMI